MIFLSTVLFIVFMPAPAFSEAVIVGERVEFNVPNLADIVDNPNISLRAIFRVEGASINLSYIEYQTNPAAPPPPTILGAPVPGSGIFPPGSHSADFTYPLSRDSSRFPCLPAKRVYFFIWAHFQDARISPQRIIGDAGLETFMRHTNDGIGKRVTL